MNTLVDTANRWGQGLVELVGPLFVQSSLLIAALLALDYALRRHVRAVVRYALWLLVLVKLVLPPSFALPTGLGYWLPAKPPTPQPVFKPGAVSVRYTDAPVPVPQPATQPTVLPSPRLDRQAVMMLGWLAGCVVLLGFLVHRSGVVRRRVAQAEDAPDDLQQLLEGCRRQMALRARVRLKLMDHSWSPAVCGPWRPVILLPRSLVDKLSVPQLRAVLLHELAHVQRGDVWVNYAQTLLQIVYWWHPLVWLANAHIRRVREEAVDELVLVALGRESDTYPSTLIEVAKVALARPLLSLGLVGILESKSSLKRRVHRLLNQPAPRSSRLSFASLSLCVVLGAVLLPMARGQRRPALSPASSPLAVATNRVTATTARTDHGEAEPVQAAQAFDWAGVSYAAKGPPDGLSWMTVLPGETNRTALAAFDWLLGELESVNRDIRVGQEELDQLEKELGIPAERLASSEELAAADEARQRTLAAAKRRLMQTELLRVLLQDKIWKTLEPAEALKDASVTAQSVATRLIDVRRKAEAARRRADAWRAKDGGSPNWPAGSSEGLLAQIPRKHRAYAQAELESGSLAGVANAVEVLFSKLAERVNSPLQLQRARDYFAELLLRNAQRYPKVKAAWEKIAQLEAEQPAPSASLTVLTVTVTAKEPFLYFDSRAVTLEDLKKEFEQAVAKHSDVALSIRADTDAPFAQIVKVMDAAKASGIRTVHAVAQRAAAPARVLTVEVSATEPFFHLAGRVVTLAELKGEFAKAAASNPDIAVVIRADNRVAFDRLTQITEAAREANINRVSFRSLRSDAPLENPPSQPQSRGDKAPLLGDLPLLGRFFKQESTEAESSVELPEPAAGGSSKASGEQLYTRVFNLDTNTLAETFKHGTSSSNGGPQEPLWDGRSETLIEALRLYLTTAGVDLQSPKSIFFGERTGKLLVRATAQDLEIVGHALTVLTAPPHQPTDQTGPAKDLTHLGAAPRDGGTRPRGHDRPSTEPARDGDESQPPPGLAKPLAGPAKLDEAPSGETDNATNLFTRRFKVDPESLIQSMAEVVAEGFRSAGHEEGHEDDERIATEKLRDFLIAAGADLTTPGKSMFLSRARGLLVRASAQDLEIVEEALQALDTPPPQTTNQARAAEALGRREAPAARAEKRDEARGGQPVSPGAPRTESGAPRIPPQPIARKAARNQSGKPDAENAKSLFTRRFKVDPNTFLQGLEKQFGGQESGVTPFDASNLATVTQEYIRACLAKEGLQLKPPAFCFYNDRTGILLVRATANDLELIEQVVQQVNKAPPQVTIETRIAEIPDEVAAQLLMIPFVMIPFAEAPNEPWPFGADETGVNPIVALAQTNKNVRVDSSRPKLQMGFLTEPQEKQLRRAMEQQAGVEVLAAPRVTTLSARQAQIQVLSFVNVITGVQVPSTEANYVTEQVKIGPLLDVTPIVQADGVTIELLTLLELTEFLGYDEGPPGLKGQPLPRFRVRELGARAKVKDGQTLVLVSEPFEGSGKRKDQVPVLGDLPLPSLRVRPLRSNSGMRPQRRLVLLLTPTITDPAGNRVHPPE